MWFRWRTLKNHLNALSPQRTEDHQRRIKYFLIARIAFRNAAFHIFALHPLLLSLMSVQKCAEELFFGCHMVHCMIIIIYIVALESRTTHTMDL